MPHPHVQLTRILVFFFSLTIYSYSVFFGFVDFDDQKILLGQPHLFNHQLSLWTTLYNIFTLLPREEPLIMRDLSWWFDAQLFGFGQAFGPHLGNVLLNAINGVLFFEFIRLTWPAQNEQEKYIPAITAVLFASSPLHVEPVAWVMGRKDLLAAFFSLLILLANHKYLQVQTANRVLYYTLSIILLPAALLSKISVVPLFLILFFQRIFFTYNQGYKQNPSMKQIIHHVLLITPHAFVSIVIVIWYKNILSEYGVLGRGQPLFEGYLPILLTELPEVFGTYTSLFLHILEPSIFFDHPAIGTPSNMVLFLTGTSTLLLFCIGFFWSIFRQRRLLFAFVSIIFLFIPYLNLTYIGIWIGVRYMYLVVGFLFFILTIVCLELHKNISFKWLIPSLGYCYFIISLLALVRYIPAWENNSSLWTYEVERDKPTILAYQALARVHIQKAENNPALSEKRLEHINLAHEYITLGTHTLNSYNHTPHPKYMSYQVIHGSKLSYWRGRIAQLLGRPPHQCIPYFLEAYQKSPKNTANNLQLAKLYFVSTSTDAEVQLSYIKKSLFHFEHYAKIALFERQEAPSSISQVLNQYLEKYQDRFPDLHQDITRLKLKLTL